MKKITKSTFKSFIKKNRAALLVSRPSSFDGMVDGIVSNDAGFKPAEEDGFMTNSLGIKGVWLVNGSRDYFEHYEQGGLVGIRVHNCCGTSIVAVRAGEVK
jgi:hypothetical protein